MSKKYLSPSNSFLLALKVYSSEENFFIHLNYFSKLPVQEKTKEIPISLTWYKHILRLLKAYRWTSNKKKLFLTCGHSYDCSFFHAN